MILQRISINGLRQCSRLNAIRQLDMLYTRSRLTHGDIIRSISGMSCAFVKQESRLIAKCDLPQSHDPGIVWQTHLVPSKRDLSSVSSKQENGHMVYMGRIHRMFRNIKIFSLTTSALGILIQPYVWYSVQDLSLMATVPLFTVINLIVFSNPFLIHFLSKRYVNELYFNPKTKQFKATVLTFFARKETLTFTADDVTVPDVPGMFSMFTVKDRPLFVDERDFTSMEVYQHLMGFDRPLDLRHESNPGRNAE